MYLSLDTSTCTCNLAKCLYLFYAGQAGLIVLHISAMNSSPILAVLVCSILHTGVASLLLHCFWEVRVLSKIEGSLIFSAVLSTEKVAGYAEVDATTLYINDSTSIAQQVGGCFKIWMKKYTICTCHENIQKQCAFLLKLIRIDQCFA